MTLRNGYSSAQLRLLLAASVIVLGIAACTTTPQNHDKDGNITYGTTPAAMVKSSESIIRQVFGPDVAPQAIDVAICESDLNPRAVSKNGADHGLFQINVINKQLWTDITGQPWDAVYDPMWNTRFTKAVWDKSGWDPWVCKYAAPQ